MIPTAIYHCNINIVSRGKSKSAVATAAYRSGEKLTNEWDGMPHDHTRKGGVVHTEIMLLPPARDGRGQNPYTGRKEERRRRRRKEKNPKA